jgi:hypothetical protein
MTTNFPSTRMPSSSVMSAMASKAGRPIERVISFTVTMRWARQPPTPSTSFSRFTTCW